MHHDSHKEQHSLVQSTAYSLAKAHAASSGLINGGQPLMMQKSREHLAIWQTSAEENEDHQELVTFSKQETPPPAWSCTSCRSGFSLPSISERWEKCNSIFFFLVTLQPSGSFACYRHILRLLSIMYKYIPLSLSGWFQILWVRWRKQGQRVRVLVSVRDYPELKDIYFLLTVSSSSKRRWL